MNYILEILCHNSYIITTAGKSIANITLTVRPAPTAVNSLEDDWDSTLQSGTYSGLNLALTLLDLNQYRFQSTVVNGSRSKGNHKQGHHRTSEGERSGTWPSLEGEEGSANVDEEDELKEKKTSSA